MYKSNDITKKLHQSSIKDFLKDKLNKDVICVDEIECIETAIRILAKHKIHSCPVVGRDGKCVGVIDMFDIVNHITKVAPISSDKASLETAGRAIALKDISSTINKSKNDVYIPIEEDNKVTLLLDMFSLGTHRCPITNKDGQVVGTISQSDIMKWLCNEAKTYLKHMELFNKPISELGLGKQKLVVVNDDTPVNEVISILNGEGVSAVPIVNNNGIINGNFSVIDLKGLYFEQWPSFFLSVIEYLSKYSPQSLIKNWKANCLNLEETTLLDVLNFFESNKYHRVWLVDDGVPLSVISHTDIINLINNYTGQ